jgi:hypothetical protein
MSRVTVTVDDAHLGTIGQVAQALQDRGMQVEEVLDAVGVITGVVPDAGPQAMADIRGIEGVVSVDAELHYQLPPPDAEIQ